MKIVELEAAKRHLENHSYDLVFDVDREWDYLECAVGGPIQIDFEDDQASPPDVHRVMHEGRLISRIEPSFGGYKKTVKIDGFCFHGFFPYRRLRANVWLCSFDLYHLAKEECDHV